KSVWTQSVPAAGAGRLADRSPAELLRERPQRPLEVQQRYLGKDPQHDREHQRPIVEQHEGGVAALVTLVDQVEIAQDSECDERHRQIEMTGSELLFDLG